MIAQSHMELTRYIPDFDISLPLSMPREGRLGASSLVALERIGRSSSRRYWLTFKGSLYIDDGEGRQRRALLNLTSAGSNHGENDPTRRVEVWQACGKALPGAAKAPRDVATRSLCDRLARDFKSAPSYAALLNTTFALVPAGRQPASYRLAEVMAAGAIPVFVSGDLRSTSPYVRPFGDVINWPSISLHFAWEGVPNIPRVLRRLSAERVAAMQQGVRFAWRNYMHPNVASQTLYGLIEARSRSQLR